MRPPVSRYLGEPYPYTVAPDPEGGYVVWFPDLPGCMTQVEEPDEIAPMAEEIRRLWIETEYDRGAEIPPPSGIESYSGKFVVRLPRSLHRRLAEASTREGVSLNQHVVALLAASEAQGRIAEILGRLDAKLDAVADRCVDGAPAVDPADRVQDDGRLVAAAERSSAA